MINQSNITVPVYIKRTFIRPVVEPMLAVTCKYCIKPKCLYDVARVEGRGQNDHNAIYKWVKTYEVFFFSGGNLLIPNFSEVPHKN